MKLTNKSVSAAVPNSFLLLLALPTFVTSTDSSSVLESNETQQVSVSDCFLLRARGRTNSSSDNSITHTRTRIRMESHALDVNQRGIRLNVDRGRFYVGHTKYTITNGIGIADHFNGMDGTIVFGFKFSMTGQDGELAEVALRGRILPQEGLNTILLRGIVSLDSYGLEFSQRGHIQKIDT